ncbi:MAG: TCR/Tet family MFS transporter [Gammaproteobacteria bacterium]
MHPSTAASSPVGGRHALTFLLIAIFIDTLGFGIVIPVLPGLLAELSGGSLADAAAWGGALAFVFALMHLIFGPVLGNLSDRYGRRPVLLASMAMLAVDYLIMGFAGSLLWLFVGRLLTGISAATFATANAYIADITPESGRAARFGLVGAAWGMGFVAGPALGGLIGELGPRVPFFVAAALAGANVLYGLLVLPETLAPEHRRPFRLSRANPVGAFRALRGYPLVPPLFAAITLYFIAHDVNPSTWTYYVLHRFQWSTAEVGLALAAVGLSSALVSGTLVGPIVRRYGELRAAMAGLVLAAASFFGYAFANAGWMVFPCIAVGAFMGLVMPALRGLLSRTLPAEQQGELQGALSSLMGLTAIIAPVLMTQAFSAFSAPDAPLRFPGASFFLAGCCAVIALWVVFHVGRRSPLESPRAPPRPDESA